jgi:hypothetical protein
VDVRKLWRVLMDAILLVWITCMLAVAVVGMLGDYEAVTGVQFVVMLAGVLVIGMAGMIAVV